MGLCSTSALNGAGTLKENLLDAMAIVPLQKSGYFAEKSPRKTSSSQVRIHESASPLKDAYEFQARLTRGFVSYERIEGKGHVCKMRDGTRISFRATSSSDGSPVVEIRISGLKRVKDQKIHFVQKGRRRV